jgi:prevent-host-death family protein
MIYYSQTPREDVQIMPNIKPVSDLRNYTEVLREVQKDAPVFLTKNGRGCYAIMDLQEYERLQAQIRLINELNKGRRSGEEKGWLTADQVRQHFREKANV